MPERVALRRLPSGVPGLIAAVSLSSEHIMNEDAINLSIRKFLKQFGVTAQREIERALQRGIADGALRGTERIPVRATLRLEGLVSDYHVDGEITLA